MWNLSEWCAAFVGAVFIFSSTQKLIDRRSWIAQATHLGVSRSIASIIAPLEGLVGVVLVAQIWPIVALVASLTLLVAFTLLLVSLLARGLRPPCACFGAARKRPISWWTVARNVVFIAINLVALLGA
ncbi:MAG: MauE/DoxX family redox-associated membrane protein [Ilumatobacteraceae bacterium]